MAQEIFVRAPQRHVDVSSRIAGFVADVASFRSIDVYDIRPLDVDVPDITFVQPDVLVDPPIRIADSVSCLYGVDPLAWTLGSAPCLVDGGYD